LADPNNPPSKNMRNSKIAFITIGLTTFHSSHAAIIVTTLKVPAAGADPSPSNTDLAQSSGTTISALTTVEANTATRIGEIFNGNIGIEGGNAADPGQLRIFETDTFQVTFDTTVNTLGYDITGIDSYFGWNPASNGRSNQGYRVDVGFVAGSSATLINAQHWEPNSPSEYWTVVSFRDANGDALNSNTVDLNGAGALADADTIATGVKSLTFTITNPANAGNGQPLATLVAREFDIFGTATVPEPSSSLLSAIAALFLLRLRQR
jgi:hypothetical protein